MEANSALGLMIIGVLGVVFAVRSDAYGGKLRTLAFTKRPHYNQNSNPYDKAALIG
ncbi:MULTISPECIES: hypothetical protein [Nostoc]|nr:MULTISPECIES: hypothetical protein [Nostoc]MBD2676657.1 hypothetical protein [Nostoc sp. FACHB-857]